MPDILFELDQYMIRRKVLKILGSSFHVFDGDTVVGYSKQKALKLKEDIRVYASEAMSEELLQIHARSIVDFSAAYDVIDSQTGEKIGAARRKGFSSLMRDSWEILDADDYAIGRLAEDSMLMATLRRFLSNLIPQSFHLESELGSAKFHQRFNPFIFKLDVEIDHDCELDRRLIFAAAVLICVIEGRQQ